VVPSKTLKTSRSATFLPSGNHLRMLSADSFEFKALSQAANKAGTVVTRAGAMDLRASTAATAQPLLPRPKELTYNHHVTLIYVARQAGKRRFRAWDFSIYTSLKHDKTGEQGTSITGGGRSGQQEIRRQRASEYRTPNIQCRSIA